jgi:hypothetical protein
MTNTGDDTVRVLSRCAKSPRWRTARRLCLGGAALAGIVGIRAVEGHDLNGLLDGAGARTGTVNGLVAFAFAVRRAPAWSTVAMALVSAAGVFAVSGAWLLPAPVLIAASLWCLMAVPDPFRGEAALGRTAEGADERGGDHARVPARPEGRGGGAQSGRPSR